MEKEIKDLQKLAADNKSMAQWEETDVIELFDNLFNKKDIPVEYAMGFIHDKMKCFNNPGLLNELYIKSKNAVSDLLEKCYNVTDVLNKNRCTIDELITLCAASEEARIKIAQHGYGLGILAKDPSNNVKLTVLKSGYYWDDSMLYSDSEIALEAISRGIALPQFANGCSSIIVQVKAICKLIELHSYDIYVRAVRQLYGIVLQNRPIMGNHYALCNGNCLDLMRIIVLLKDAVRTELKDSGIDNLI